MELTRGWILWRGGSETRVRFWRGVASRRVRNSFPLAFEGGCCLLSRLEVGIRDGSDLNIRYFCTIQNRIRLSISFFIII